MSGTNQVNGITKKIKCRTVWKCGHCNGTYFNNRKELENHLDGQICGSHIKNCRVEEVGQHLVRTLMRVRK